MISVERLRFLREEIVHRRIIRCECYERLPLEELADLVTIALRQSAADVMLNALKIALPEIENEATLRALACVGEHRCAKPMAEAAATVRAAIAEAGELIR